MYLGMNNTKPPFDNEKVRQAIAMGIDRQAIVDKYLPARLDCGRLLHAVRDPRWLRRRSLVQVRSDGGQETADGGRFPEGGFKTTLSYRDVVRGYLPTPGKVAEELQAQLKKTGHRCDHRRARVRHVPRQCVEGQLGTAPAGLGRGLS